MTYYPVQPALLDLLRQAQISQNAFSTRPLRLNRRKVARRSVGPRKAMWPIWRSGGKRLALRVKAILQNESQLLIPAPMSNLAPVEVALPGQALPSQV